MTKNDFQMQLLSQIGIMDLADGLLNFENDHIKAIEKRLYLLSSDNILKDGNEAYTNILVNKLLNNAKIPKGLLNLIKDNTPALSSRISASTWDYFYNYEFNGNISITPTFNIPVQLEGNFLIEIIAEDVIIDIISKPVNLLIGMIEHFTKIWTKILNSGAKTYYLPKHHAELPIYVESEVARFYNVEDTAIVAKKSPNSIFNGYRFVGLIDTYPFDLKLVNSAIVLANQMASSTS
jgi:hypothetical protein